MSDEEFGPWIAHDGKGCPCEGQVVKIELRGGMVIGPYIAGSRGAKELAGNPSHDGWVHLPKSFDVVRYRIKKPRGLTLLEEILKEVNDTHPLKVKRFKEESLP